MRYLGWYDEPWRQFSEFIALHRATNRDFAPSLMTFAHPRDSGLREIHRILRCPVEFAQTTDSYRIDGGGGFLRSAAMTATGIVGRALVFEGIQSMFGQHDAATITGNQAALPGLGETFLSKRYGAETGASAAGSTSDHKIRDQPGSE